MFGRNRYVRISHRASGVILAEGPLGWQITPFEGNYYISKWCLKAGQFRQTWIPGVCPYKFLYVWLDLDVGGAVRERRIAWMYWLPNPLLPFIWFRVALPGSHPALYVQTYDGKK